MICFVCTENADQTLAIFGEDNVNSKIAAMIEKHLCLKPQEKEEQNILEICIICLEKLRDFNEFYEFVEIIHNEESKSLKGLLLEDTGSLDTEKNIWDTNINTEALEETLHNNVKLRFMETEDAFSENPLLGLEPEADNDMDDFKNIDTKKKNKKPKAAKTKKSQKIMKRAKNLESSDSYYENEESLASLLDESKNEDSEETSDTNNQIKVSSKRKKIQKRTQIESKSPKKIDKPNESKRKKGHVLLEENYSLIKKHIKMLCQMCSFIGEDFSNLIKHYKDAHVGVKPFIKCCERKLDCPSEILQHAYFHEDPEHFKCQECGKTFTNNSAVKDHFRRNHEREENLPYGCDECPRRFSGKLRLARHKAKHIPKTEMSQFCQICAPPKAFASEYLLQIHIKSRHTKESNVCNVCSKEIRNKKVFEKHVRLHFETSGPPIKCPREGCESWLKDEDNLKQHFRRIHNQSKIVCPECGRICKNNYALACHLRNTHPMRRMPKEL